MMKLKNLLFSSLFLLFTFTISAQSFDVLTVPMRYETQGTSYAVNLVGASQKRVIQEWRSFISEFGGRSYVTGYHKGVVEMESYGATLPFLQDASVAFYAELAPNSTGTGVKLYYKKIQLEDSCYFDENIYSADTGYVNRMLFDFRAYMSNFNRRVAINNRR